jgi:hypothetical protein
VTIAVTDFVTSARATGKAAGLPDIRIASYPGAIAIHPLEVVKKNIREVVFPQVIKLLTKPVAKLAASAADMEAIEKAVVFEGSFEEVNDHFCAKQWTDGLPIVPPTEEKVAQFLKCTDRSPGEVLGALHPSLRPATVQSIAVNGVMAGCRPEYMPVLVAVVEAIADPRFHLEDAGSSAGWAPLIILNGPVIKRLKFNSGTGVLRVGHQANTSVGRFLRLYLRNVAGFIPGVGDMATFGRPNLPVLAENEDASPWEPLSVTRGFQPAESVVTVNSVGFMSFQLTVVAQTPIGILDNITRKVGQIFLAGDGSVITKGPEVSPLLALSPVLARTLASGGYTKKGIQEYIYEHARVPAKEFDAWLAFQGIPNVCECVSRGLLPAHFRESDDPQRMLPLFHAPEELQIVVAGTEERNRFFVAQQVGRHGLATSRKINLSLLHSS